MKRKIIAVIMAAIMAFTAIGSSLAAYCYLSGSDSEVSSVSVDASLVR